MAYPVDIDKIKTLFPEKSISLVIDFDNDQEIAQELTERLQKHAALWNFTDISRDGAKVSVTIRDWATLKILDTKVLGAKNAIYAKRFGKD